MAIFEGTCASQGEGNESNDVEMSCRILGRAPPDGFRRRRAVRSGEIRRQDHYLFYGGRRGRVPSTKKPSRSTWRPRSSAGIDALPATFKTNGKSVKVGAKVQVSGKTVNDFTKPVVYTVTADDGSTQELHGAGAGARKSSPSRAMAAPWRWGATAASGERGATRTASWGWETRTASTCRSRFCANGVASVSLGYYHSLILKTDGSLWAAGYNKLGQLGNGGTASSSTPVQVFADGVASSPRGSISASS